MRVVFVRFLLLCAFSTVVVKVLSAQVVLEIGPRAGHYRPQSNVDGSVITRGGLPHRPEDLTGGAWGGVGRVWFGSRVGFQAQGALVRHTVAPANTPAGWTSLEAQARVLAASADVLLAILSDPQRYRTWVGAGVGAVHHGGSAYREVGAPTFFAPAVSMGANVRLIGRLRVGAGVEGMQYMYDLPMPQGWDPYNRSLQRGRRRDALITFGVEWSFR